MLSVVLLSDSLNQDSIQVRPLIFGTAGGSGRIQPAESDEFAPRASCRAGAL